MPAKKNKLSPEEENFLAYVRKNYAEGADSDDNGVPDKAQRMVADIYEQTGGLMDPSQLNRLSKSLGSGLAQFGSEAVDILNRVIGQPQLPTAASKGLPGVSQKLEEKSQELEPEDPSFLEGVVKRGARTAPYLAGGGIAGMARGALGAGLGGQSAEALGGGPLAQAVGEIGGMGLSGIGARQMPKGAPAEERALLERFGATPEEVTPLYQGEQKQRFLGKLADKGEKTQERLGATKERIQDIYGYLAEEHPAAEQVLASGQKEGLMGNLQKSLNKLTSRERNLIKEDFEILKNSPGSAEDLINFYGKINKSFSPKNKAIQKLKGPIVEAVESISPELAQDFKTINEIYSRYYPMARRLAPSLLEDLFDQGKAIGLTGAFITGNLEKIAKFAGKYAGVSVLRKVSREVLLNPKLQNLSSQIVSALNKKRYGVANSLLRRYADDIKEDFPDIAQELYEADMRKLRED